MEDRLRTINLLRPLLGQKHQNGVNDCNLIFLELYYPDMANQIRGKYSTDSEGFKLAKELFGYRTIGEFIADNKEWIECDSEYAAQGDVFISGRSVVICLGTKSFYFDEDDVYKQVPTDAVRGTLYKRLNNGY